MHKTGLSWGACLSGLGATAAQAAPTCQDKMGATLRCGTTGAMPVGWSPPADARWLHILSLPKPDMTQMLSAVCWVVLLLALYALMPPFDGSSGRDWGRQESDDERG